MNAKKWFRLTCKLLLAFLVAFSVIPVSPHSAQAAEPESVEAVAKSLYLRNGSTGRMVSLVQKNLKTLGYFKYPRVTGEYGYITTKAVRRFQKAYSLPATGVVNYKTFTEIQHAIVKKYMIANTKRFIGVKYVWGAKDPAIGFDCSGFIYYMFRKHGVYNIPRVRAVNLYAMGKPVPRYKLQPGDLVFYAMEDPHTVSHVGFYMGHNKFISATSSKGIWIYPLTNRYWAPHYMGARRIY